MIADNTGPAPTPSPPGVSLRGIDPYVHDIDRALHSHLEWALGVMRGAILREPAPQEVLAPDAHERCAFGAWLDRRGQWCADVDAEAFARAREDHRRMHDAARRIGRTIADGETPSANDLDSFQNAQQRVVDALARLKTRALARSARLDALTGLPMRHGIEEEAGRMCGLAGRIDHQVIAVMIDIDRFKTVNDTYGHVGGDAVLAWLAETLRRETRANDVVFRYGGEEFLLLMLAAEAHAAEHGVERMLAAIREGQVELESGEVIGITVSAGMSPVRGTDGIRQAIARADTALYRAKREGRDRWCWEDPPADPA